MPEHWASFAIQEIERSNRRFTAWEKEFLYGNGGNNPGVKKRIEMGLSLTKRQETSLLELHRACTEVKRIKW